VGPDPVSGFWRTEKSLVPGRNLTLACPVHSLENGLLYIILAPADPDGIEPGIFMGQ